ncbi:hypothetical protein GSI_07068 [Ganoderma sinense ZZ0214-1]|uniref:Transporter n=1 Tax=Ganoderma sinense ZZ0214-1 TaxID=1077348 RepID=A0A2G8SAV9_9APHY|nr:hypothetical protein GSI_07068 [Ganoderma sinense ZZ0214-1]
MLLPLDILSLLFLSLSASHLLPQASAVLVNVTVDDTFGDPATGNQIIYEPQGLWQLGQSCNGCTARPDKFLAFNGTWHDSTFNDASLPDANQLPIATFSFTGVAVYVYCIVTHSFNPPDGNSDMSFLIDNVVVGTFQQPPTGDPSYLYNDPVYVNDSLSPGPHTIAIVNGQVNGNKSLALLDYIVYTRVDNSTSDPPVPSPTPTSIFTSLSPSSPPQVMAASSSSGLSSSRRTVIIAVVASLGGVLALVALIAAIIYLGRRRAKDVQPGSQNGVIASDAAPIDQEDPNTSGWVEGTWAGDEEDGQNGARRAPSNGRRKRGPSNASASNISLPTTPSTRSLNKPLPLPSVTNVQTRLPYVRGEPVSPSSSFGNVGSAPPDSATFFIPVPPVPPIPPLPVTAAPPVRPQRPTADSDTFLDMGRSSVIEPNLSTLPSHPFATAQAYSPSSSSPILMRQRSETNPSLTIPPPSASSTALAAATRGYTYASATTPTRKRSDSDLERERRQQLQQQHHQQQIYSRTNPPSRQRSGSDLSNSAYARAAPAPGARQRAGSDLEVNYPRGDPVVNPLTVAPLTVTRQRSGSDLEKGDYASAYSGMQSPSTFVSTLPSTVTTPTSMTALMPKAPRNPGPTQGQGKKDAEKERERGKEKEKPSPARAAAPRRKVDPIDPSLQPPRDSPPGHRQASLSRSASRSRGHDHDAEQSQSPSSATGSSRSARRGGIVMSDRDRERFGFLDVPQDASLSLGLDSRPPSYREADR